MPLDRSLFPLHTQPMNPHRHPPCSDHNNTSHCGDQTNGHLPIRPWWHLPVKALIYLIITVLINLLVLCPDANAVTLPGEYVNPVTGLASQPIVTRSYDKPTNPYGPGHRGVDLLAPTGSLVLAAGDGTVYFSGTVVYQPTVSITHAHNIRTTYQPVTAWVVPGQQVRKGQPIGIVANVPSTHLGLHWGARTGPKLYMNPLDLLSDPSIRLKRTTY